jgi:hypothetical protein
MKLNMAAALEGYRKRRREDAHSVGHSDSAGEPGTDVHSGRRNRNQLPGPADSRARLLVR